MIMKKLNLKEADRSQLGCSEKDLMNHVDTFKIDATNSDEEYLYVDVEGLGTVIVKAQEEGIVVDIYPFHVVDEAVASTWAHINDLSNPQIEVDYEAHNSRSSGDNAGTRKLTGGIG